MMKTVQRASNDLGQRLSTNLEVLRATASFVSSVDEALTQARFRAFTRPLLERHPAVYALEWAPRVRHPDRRRFEEHVRRAFHEDFRIVEPVGNAGLQAAPARDEYYPVLFEEPHGEGVGLDLTFEPTRRSDIQEAVRSGEIVTSAPFDLAELTSREKHVAVYLPVANPPGLSILVLKTESLFRDWVEGIDDPRVRVWVKGRETPSGQLVFGLPEPVRSDRQWEEDLPLGRGSLTLGFAVPPGFGGWDNVGWGTGLVFVLGLVATAGVWVYDRVGALQREVERANRLGQYVVERKLGQGGMGVVFLARHAMMKRPTALKLMLSQHPNNIDRFEREVTLSCQLNHPNIVSIYDFGRTEDGVFYYAMEYLSGLDLHSLVVNYGPIHDGRAVFLLAQTVRGLRAAHRAGLVHRDVKPGNLFVTHVGTEADLLKVLDFGLVKTVEDPDSPDAGRMVGTPLFMAPEAIDHPEKVGPAADIYAVGCVAYHLLAGRPPFFALDSRAILKAHKEDVPPSLKELSRYSISKELDALVRECMRKEPELRPSDDELLARLAVTNVYDAWTDADAAQWWEEHDRERVHAKAVSDPGSRREVTVVLQRRRGV